MRRLPLFICVTLIACPAQAQHSDAARAADAILVDLLAADQGAGVQAAVVVDGSLLWVGCAGRADMEWDIPMAADVRMRIGSVSKPLSAALAASLVEEGLIDPDAPIGVVLEDLPSDKSVITLRQLGLHTSGIRHYDFGNYLEANNVFVRANLMEALSPLLEEPLAHPPGESVTYTSIGYNLLGAVLEKAAGEPFGDAFAARVAGPLGLGNTVIDAPLAPTPRRAGFYTVFPGGELMNTLWRDSSDGYPSLGILSTATDLARFADSVFNSSGLDSLRAISLTQGALNDGTLIDRTFGWEIGRDKSGAVAWYGHNGETNGGMAVVRYFPALRMSVAGTANYNVFPGTEPTFYDAISRELPSVFAASLNSVEISR